jgi:hypothetical protein
MTFLEEGLLRANRSVLFTACAMRRAAAGQRLNSVYVLREQAPHASVVNSRGERRTTAYGNAARACLLGKKSGSARTTFLSSAVPWASRFSCRCKTPSQWWACQRLGF